MARIPENGRHPATPVAETELGARVAPKPKSQPTETLRQVDAWGVVVCCWLHLSRIAVVYFAQHSPVLQAFAKAQNSEKFSLWCFYLGKVLRSLLLRLGQGRPAAGPGWGAHVSGDNFP